MIRFDQNGSCSSPLKQAPALARALPLHLRMGEERHQRVHAHGDPGRLRRAAPRLGADSAAVLHELGCDASGIATLFDEGIVAGAR